MHFLEYLNFEMGYFQYYQDLYENLQRTKIIVEEEVKDKKKIRKRN